MVEGGGCIYVQLEFVLVEKGSPIASNGSCFSYQLATCLPGLEEAELIQIRLVSSLQFHKVLFLFHQARTCACHAALTGASLPTHLKVNFSLSF
ncbi:hypothetical protein OPV22_028801 [Ensete ventricosum]|uniref:Uncharacterized protein n=1 Tax=Ensete ventricosum TaxID=4639 RepID=A0AAV8Q4R3_ENSVE|nr:hypothetical protein OPV22_028801 [Ensete ventricosum]